MPFQLTYRSQAIHPLGHLSDIDILREALAHNQTHGITGYLVRDNKDFVQTLEGDRITVRTLYTRIKRDERHYNVTLLQEREIDHPMFPDWSMGYSELRSNNLARAKDAALAHAKENPAEAGRVVDFLREVAAA